MLGEFFSMRRALAHNDIYWNNVAVHKVDGRSLCRVIDFKLMESNTIGADLHHFARHAQRRPEIRKFYDALVSEAAISFNATQQEIVFASTFYAAIRCVGRVRGRCRRAKDEAAQKEWLVCQELLSAAWQAYQG